MCIECVLTDPEAQPNAVIVVGGNSLCGKHAADFIEMVLSESPEVDTEAVPLHTEN